MPKWLKWVIIVLIALILLSPIFASEIVGGFLDFLGTAKDNVTKFLDELSN